MLSVHSHNIAQPVAGAKGCYVVLLEHTTRTHTDTVVSSDLPLLLPLLPSPSAADA